MSGPVSSITADIIGPSHLVTGVVWSSIQHHSRHHRSHSPGYRCCLVQCPAHNRHHRSQSPGFRRCLVQCPSSQPTSLVPVTWLKVLSGPVSSITTDITGPSNLVTGDVWSSVQHHSRHHRSQSPGYRCCLVQCPASQPTS